VEAKTTGLGKSFPIYIAATQVRCSEDVGGRPQLFRVFDPGWAPRAYILARPLRARCHLGADAVPGDGLRSARLRGGGRYTGGHKVTACGVEVRPGGLPGFCLPGFPLVRAPPSC
jgi:hypothetical protein